MVALISLGAAPLFAARTDRNIKKIEDAITAGDLGQVKSALRKLDKQELSLEKKKALYERLQEKATDEKEEFASSMIFYNDTIDSLNVLAGVLSALWGALVVTRPSEYFEGAYRVQRNVDPEHFDNVVQWHKIGVGTFLGAASVACFYRGLTCSSQNVLLKNYEEIESYLDNQLNVLEFAEDEDDDE